jgi:hypothetical protein
VVDTGVHRARTLHDLDRLRVEWIRVSGVRTLADAVHGDVIRRSEAADVDAVAIAPTFARTESNAWDVLAQHVTQQKPPLLLDQVRGNHRHRLRRIA